MTRNALLPRFHDCGGPGKERCVGSAKRGRPRIIVAATGLSVGINIGPEERGKLQRGFRMFVLKERGKGGYTVKKAYEMTLMRFFAVSKAVRNGVVTQVLPPANDLPSLRQFVYWGTKGRDLKESLIRRYGQRRYNLSLRPILGDATSMGLGPGSLYQIDATIADIWIVSALVRSRRLGRPVLYLVIDTFSHAIVGFHLGLENASFFAAGLALENAYTDKVKYCAQFGIVIASEQWPNQGLPEGILADRGELEGYGADNIVKALNIGVSNAAPYRADAKGIVERSFRTLNDMVIHWQPGAVFKPLARGERDPRLEATFTLHELRLLVIHAVLHHNQTLLTGYRLQEDMIADEVTPRPIDLWEWGVANRR
jgi:putative transposase